jgi:hypothetical protein
MVQGLLELKGAVWWKAKVQGLLRNYALQVPTLGNTGRK